MKLNRILILALSAFLLTACGGAEERKAVYLEKAKSSLEAGDLDKARIELKNVTQIDPKDSNAIYMLGQVFEQQKDYRKAFSHYLRVEELAPDNLVNQAKLGSIYLILANDKDKAQEKIDYILNKDPQHAEGLLLKAAMMLKDKKPDEALGIAKSVVNNQPGHVDAAILLASLYMNEKNSADAISTLEQALKANPGNEKLNNFFARVLVTNKDYDRAEAIYKAFLENKPDSVASYNNLASFYNESGNKEKAEKTLRASIENNTSDVERQIILVKYIKATKGDDAAINELKSLISKNKGLGKLRTALAELFYLTGDKDSAITVYENAIKDFPEEVTGIEARISLASIYFNDKNFEAANKVINDAASVSPNDPKVNFLKAKLAINENNIEQAIIALRIVTKETPENIEAFMMLANAYQLEGNTEQVKSTLNSAYENNRTDADALLKLAKIQLARDIDAAEKIIDDYNKVKESDYDGLSIKAAILNQKKSYEEANKIANVMMETFPDKPAGYLQAVPYYGELGDKQKIISILEQGYINAYKNNRQLLVLLTSLQMAEKEFDIVEKRLKAELVAAPDDVELNVLLSKVYLVKNDVDSAAIVLKNVVAKTPGVEEPYLILSQIYQSKNDSGAVKSILLEGKTNVANSMKIPLRLATVYEAERDYAKSIAIYRELNQKSPDNLIVANNLASMLSDHGNEEDLQLAKSLTVKLEESGEPVFLDTIGWVYYKLGDYDQSISYLKQVVEKMPEVNVFNYHLGMAYKMAGDKAQARVYLEKSLADGKAFLQKESAEAALKEL